MFLYVVTNLVNDKQYVGITVDYKRRWREHCTGHGSKLVYQAIKKYGIENIEFTVICKGTEAYVKEMEVRAILMLKTMAHSGYNLTEGGEGSPGVKLSNETRKKMRDSHKGTTGQKMLEATKQKIRESRQKYKRGKHPKATRVVVNGISYDCLRDVAEALGVTYSTLCTFQRGISSKVFDYPPEVEELTINGVNYVSIKEASKALGVSGGTLWSAKKRQGGSNVFDYHEKGRIRGNKHHKAKKVTVNGVEYGCIKDAAENLGVNYSTLRDARRRAKFDTFTYQRGEAPKPAGGVSSPESN